MVQLWRRTLSRGRDVTELSRSRSCLVIAAHPDDETLGCGARIAQKRQAGTPVRVVIATDGRHSTESKVIDPGQLAQRRSAEAREAATALGLAPSDLIFLAHEDGSLMSRIDELTEQVAGVLHDFAPDEMLTTSALDGHPDHVALNTVARRLVATQQVSRVAEYPIWYFYGGPVAPAARHRIWSMVREIVTCRARLHPEVVATAGFLNAKLVALDAYRSQVTNLTGEPDWSILPQDFLQCFLQSHEIFFPMILDLINTSLMLG